MLRFVLALVLSMPAALAAQERRPSHCIAIAESAPSVQFVHFGPEIVHLASAHSEEAVPPETVRLRYLQHASFLIETHGGLTAITDFTGFTGARGFVPDVVTMNHAHSSHWTASPSDDIPHVLRGWSEQFGIAIDHYLDLGEMLIRNVSTDIRSAFAGTEENGNSIFVFEVAGLCVGHLGHLHHIPSDEQFAALGRLDVVMAPVDGGLTLPLPEMITVLKRLRSSIVIPMHWFSGFSLRAFAQGMEGEFEVLVLDVPYLDVSLRSLPRSPTVMILQPQFVFDLD
ncbi:MBL fold metallo-hydrolase [Pseudaestuariivita atlantica]|uniref:Zn-dependent hydrolase n=1 Tax=Pseudaestuariivita atlantica TaxID=1317121 RepID=A0A0L1JSR4_9RHOB|nr:MBL fold metallo-hydrolase [Pseudaestuariivita atlantica]KNG94824.1 Zn-dependent hydrolase [Pseudaestuariivita atlantica]